MKSGEEYERLSQEVVQALNSTKTVRHNVKIHGKLTEVKRQIDVKLDENDYDFVVYECKDWKKKIGVGVVGQFITDLEDVGAKKGAIISNSPFTKGAMSLANKKGVDLLHLVKTDNKKLKVGLKSLVLAIENSIESYNFSIRDQSFNAPQYSIDPEEFILIYKNQELTVKELLKRKWNEGLNISAKLGKNTISIDNAEIIDITGTKYTISNFTVSYIVKEIYFHGSWIIEEAQGLYNVLDKSFRAYGKTASAPMSIDELQRTFKEISAAEAKKNTYTFKIVIASAFV